MNMKNFNQNVVVAIVVVSFGIGLVMPVGTLAAKPSAIDLGTAGDFVILSKTGISTTGSTKIVGDIGVSPIAASAITGFALTLPTASAFSTSALVTGKVYASNYANPTPTNMTTAISNMQTAYTNAAGRTNPTATELGAGNIGGLTITSGLYKWSTGVTIPTNVTISGSANDVWIFQIAQTLTVSSGVKIILSGGAQASNIFWVVAGQTTIGTTAVFNGNILDKTAIVLNTGAVLNGRALAQTAVTLDSNVVTMPSSSGSTPAVPAIPATPAIPAVNPAVPATPAVPASPSSNNGVGSSSYLVPLDTTPVATVKNGNTNTNPSSAFGQQVRTIAISLGKGNYGNDVTILQEFLISQNKGSEAQALAKVGATAYFGLLTRAALAEFQANVGINPSLGNFGPITRNYMSMHY
ncbi:MAG: ice-binding family protein [Candidatus Paceibacterota bacterium]|jgi:hypothetical protein